jgi:repressor of nif and glnA expression
MKKEKPDQELEECIQSIFDENDGNYGYRRIHLELKNRGYKVNHKKVQRIMKKLGLKGDKFRLFEPNGEPVFGDHGDYEFVAASDAYVATAWTVNIED